VKKIASLSPPYFQGGVPVGGGGFRQFFFSRNIVQINDY